MARLSPDLLAAINRQLPTAILGRYSDKRRCWHLFFKGLEYGAYCGTDLGREARLYDGHGGWLCRRCWRLLRHAGLGLEGESDGKL